MTQPSARPSTHPKGRILLVEDDRPTYIALRALLARRGWEVVIATTLAEAMPLLDEPFQIIILDLMLPDGDGAAVLQQVRRKNLPLRVVVTTGSNDPVRLRSVGQLHPEALLHKPVDLNELERALG